MNARCPRIDESVEEICGYHNGSCTMEDARHREDTDMTVLRVMASRHSAFYSPLLGAIAGGFLQEVVSGKQIYARTSL